MTPIPDPIKCPYCAGFHEQKCPMVKAFEYHADGSLKRVEFLAPRDYVAASGDLSKVLIT